MAGEIVHDHDVIWLESWRKDLFNVIQKALAVDWPVKDARGVNPVMAECCHKGRGFPVPVRHVGHEPLAFAAPAPQRRHVGLCPGLVNEDQPPDGDARLVFPPGHALSCNIRPLLLGGVNAFF